MIAKTFADKFIIESDLKALLFKFMRIESNLKNDLFAIWLKSFQWLTCIYILVYKVLSKGIRVKLHCQASRPH